MSADVTAARPRVTMTRLVILRAIRSEPERRWYGNELAKRTGIHTETVYRILKLFRTLEWVSWHWEDDKSDTGPRRRYHVLTTDPALRAAVDDFTKGGPA